MIGDVSVIVLTPVKNEEWIMEKFLQITSMFADKILVADQLSTDSTVSIIQKYSKAVYIPNSNPEYDEAYRQQMLIEKAREIVPGKKILLALDADELITANSISSEEWAVIGRLEPGTRIFFKKPDLLPGGSTYVDYPDFFLLGYVDDGRQHQGTKFHSPRVPAGDSRYEAQSITFLHLALIRELEYNARQRLYSVLENVDKTSSLRFRYRKYARRMLNQRYEGLTKDVPRNWVAPFLSEGIDIAAFPSSENNIYNKRLLAMFNEHGYRRFWYDDIWEVDYNNVSKITGEPLKKQVEYPPFHISLLRRGMIFLYSVVLALKKNQESKSSN